VGAEHGTGDRTWAGWPRVALGGALTLAGLQSVAPAANSALWLLGLAVNEWGYLIAPLGLAPLAPGWRRTRSGRLGAALGLLGAGLALGAVLRAIPTARALPARLTAAFGPAPPRARPGAPPRPAPLVAPDLVRGYPTPGVTHESLDYAAPAGAPLRLDLYRAPAAGRPAPCVITIHGGAWQSGARGDYPGLNNYLAARGYVVAAIDYRLSSQAPFPAAADDTRAALAYLKAHAPDLGIDPTRFALLGRSAGGQLALLTAYTPPDPAIRGVISVYGPADLVYGYRRPANPAVIDSRAVLDAYLGASPGGAPAAYHAASPINFIGPTTPPTLLVHGRRDDLVAFAQSARLDARLAAAGRPHLLVALPWANHGCDVNLQGPAGQITLYAIERFLAAVLR
jgi:acetyl esterase/lipase